jgi:hypothetical protein
VFIGFPIGKADEDVEQSSRAAIGARINLEILMLERRVFL